MGMTRAAANDGGALMAAMEAAEAVTFSGSQPISAVMMVVIVASTVQTMVMLIAMVMLMLVLLLSLLLTRILLPITVIRARTQPQSGGCRS